MAYNFRGVDRDQSFLMPPSVDEWLPEGHLAWFVIDAVEQMDLSGFYAGYRADGWGGGAYHPRMMVTLLLYAYCIGQRSSRRIERACEVDVAFRVITGNEVPDHTAIARFRARHEKALAGVFTESLRLCAAAGMAAVGVVAVDGTKMTAAASMAANATGSTIDEAVAGMLAEAKAADDAEDALFASARGDEPPAGLRGRADRRARFAAAKKLLDEQAAAARAEHEAHLAARAAEEERRGSKLRGRKPKPPGGKAGDKPAKANTTDPDSRMMSTAKGFVQGYNAQAVANDEQVIVAAQVTDEHNDSRQLHPMIAATRESLADAGIGEKVDKLLADAGYASEENLAALSGDDPDCYVATRNMRNNPSPRTGRRGPLRKDATEVEKMDRKVSVRSGRKIYRRRQAIIEPVFGQIKHARGIRGFSRRGKAAADAEWKLICGTHNLLKLYRNTQRRNGATARRGTPRAAAATA